MRLLDSPTVKLLPVVGLSLLLSACTNGISQQKSAPPVSYADVEKNMKGAVGKNVIWIGKQLESHTIRDGQGKIVERTRTYLLQVPSATGDDLKWFVVDEETAKHTDAAEKLDRTPGDSEIKKISGTISTLTRIKFYVNGQQREADVPLISNATVDAPDNAAKK